MEPYFGDLGADERFAQPEQQRMAPSIPPIDRDRVISLVTADVVATLGAEHAALVPQNAAVQLEFAEDGEEFARRLAEVVQQDVHDEFIDTTWPACPRHGRHPLWYRDGAWWCEKDGVALARLGDLVSLRDTRGTDGSPA